MLDMRCATTTHVSAIISVQLATAEALALVGVQQSRAAEPHKRFAAHLAVLQRPVVLQVGAPCPNAATVETGATGADSPQLPDGAQVRARPTRRRAVHMIARDERRGRALLREALVRVFAAERLLARRVVVHVGAAVKARAAVELSQARLPVETRSVRGHAQRDIIPGPDLGIGTQRHCRGERKYEREQQWCSA